MTDVMWLDIRKAQERINKTRNASNKASRSLKSMPEDSEDIKVHSYEISGSPKPDNRRYYYFFDGSIVAVDDGLMMDKNEIEEYSKPHGPLLKMVYQKKAKFFNQI